MNKVRLYSTMIFLAVFVLPFHSLAAPKETPAPSMPSKLSSQWVVDEGRLQVATRATYEASRAVIEEARNKGVYDVSLRRLTAEDYRILLSLAWSVIAIGEYAMRGESVETLLKDIESNMGDIMIPPWVCFPEAYRSNIDAMALNYGKTGIPYPEPKFRPLRELVASTRARVKQRVELKPKQKAR